MKIKHQVSILEKRELSGYYTKLCGLILMTRDILYFKWRKFFSYFASFSCFSTSWQNLAYRIDISKISQVRTFRHQFWCHFFFLSIFENISYLRWYVLYLQGAKLFYLSGLVYGSYPKVEIHNLGRFIAVSKFRPLTWRVSHPYILADR